MTPERWAQITEIYHSAQELDSARRSNFLEQACAGDASLRREVESLLAADAEAQSFIARPALSDAAALLATEYAPSLIGRNLGHYRVISRIGAGGMGEVYLAEDSKLGRRVALKTLPGEFCGDPHILQRFKIEARAAATLNHPCIATLYSVEEIDDRYFITLEYVAGENLADVISAGETDLDVSLDWFLCLADALAHSHEQGVIHRDIKPGNVMIKTDGVPKILDFGLAQIDRAKDFHSASNLKLTHNGQVFGTPSYMSPEQAEGKAVDHRGDIFSFGVLMYEVITGTRPFKGDSYASIISELLKSEPPPVAEIKPETPLLLTRLIERCLRKSRTERPQSMREICAVLEDAKAAVEAGVSVDSFARRLLPKPESSSRPWIFAFIGLFIASFSVVAYYYFRPDSPPINFANMTLRKLSQTNNVRFAHVTPDGKSLVYQTVNENDSRTLWIRRIEEKNALQLVAPQPVLYWGGFAVSPDGAQIFYIAAEPDARHGALYRISSLGGAPRKLNDVANDVGAVSPDGNRILFVRYGTRGQIVSANAADGGDERVIQTGEPNHIFRDPQFSPDGTSVFYSKLEKREGEEFWSVVEIPASGGEEETILSPRKQRIGELAVLKTGGGLLINKTDAVSNLQQIFHVALPGGELQRVTNDLNSYTGVSASDDGNKIVAVQRHESSDIWIASGENMEKITTESNVYDTAVFAPDGRIVYDATDNNRPHIWVTNHDGTNAQQLTPNDSSDFQPRVSSDGRFIVFTSERTGERKVWRMNIDGSAPQMLTHVSGMTSNPVIMPDAQTVLFSWATRDAVVLGKIPLAGGAVTEQPLFGKQLWSLAPDGEKVAYVFYDEPSREYKVRVRPFETDEPSTIFDISPTNFLSWTADGKNLLYREIEPSQTSSSTVWRQPLAGGEPKSFLSVSPDEVFNVAQSADGKKTAVVRGRYSSDAVMLTRIKQN
jgi:serine/threonine protein kinase/WD40 repeat protein